MAFKIEDDNQNTIIRHYQDAFLQMNDYLAQGDYGAYFRLVDHLENMCVLALDAEEMKKIREIRALIRTYTEKISTAGANNINSSEIIKRDAANAIAVQSQKIVMTYVRYPLYRVIERICIDSLKRTVLSTAQGGSKYSDSEDLDAVKTEIEYDLKKYGCAF